MGPRELYVKITVVVEYLADDVIKFVGSLFRLVHFVHNPDFARTGTAFSIARAAKHDEAVNIVLIDGDVLVHHHQLKKILSSTELVIGVTKRLPSDGVRVKTEQRFMTSLEGGLDLFLEWSGIFKISTEFARGMFIKILHLSYRYIIHLLIAVRRTLPQNLRRQKLG